MIKRLPISLFLIVMTVLEVFSFTARPAYAAAYNPKSVLLKLNNCFILYSYEQMPYIDASGRVLFPLRMIGDLIGDKVEWDATDEQGTLITGDMVIRAGVGISTQRSMENPTS